MNEIKQNEYLLKCRKEKEWLNRKQLKFLRDTAITSDDSGDEFEKQKQIAIFIKQKKKQFQWEQRSLTNFSSKFGKVQSEEICLKINHYLLQINNLFKKIRKHLTPLPPYIITPDGSIKMAWDLLCLAFVIYEMISIPFQISFEIEISKEISMTSFVVFAFDILLNFNTGVYLDGTLSMKRERIIKNYLSFWFWIDLISTFPYDIIIDESESLIQSAKLLRLFKFLKFIHILKLLRLAKLKKIINKLDEVIQNIKMIGIIITFFKLFVFGLFLAHVLGCIFHYASREESNSWLGDNENADWQIRYIYSLYWGIATMTTVGYGDISPTTTTERGLGIILLLVACGGFAFTMNSIGFALSSLEERTNVRKSKINVLNKYMKQANIPDVLQNKVRKYLEYVWDSHQILLNDITSLLSQELCKDLQEQVNGKLFGHINIFWQFHSFKFLVEGIIPILEDKLYLPEEIIFNEIPSTNYDLFLIQKGEVSIFFMKTDIVHQKINTEQFSVRADFLPVYTEISWTGHFAGLFHIFYEALDDLCEFRGPNVSSCYVGSRIKNMLQGMKRYLTKMSLITWSPDEFKSWFESRDKKMELEYSRRKNTEGKKKKEEKKTQKPSNTRSTSKKRDKQACQSNQKE